MNAKKEAAQSWQGQHGDRSTDAHHITATPAYKPAARRTIQRAVGTVMTSSQFLASVLTSGPWLITAISPGQPPMSYMAQDAAGIAAFVASTRARIAENQTQGPRFRPPNTDDEIVRAMAHPPTTAMVGARWFPMLDPSHFAWRDDKAAPSPFPK
jgi:hypothetical protein